ncbi:MAG: WecB/TagA/CpsF family glycosyltransferase [Brevinematia bacterium]
MSTKKAYKIFLYGTTEKTLQLLKENLLKKFPKLKIVLTEPSKFRELTNDEWIKLVEKIKTTKPDIIFIGLGSPLQEIFSYRLDQWLKKENQRKIIIPVGAAFDFISGIKKQAPKWMGEWGLEWLWRLINEPRLIKRYFIYGLLFLIDFNKTKK